MRPNNPPHFNYTTDIPAHIPEQARKKSAKRMKMEVDTRPKEEHCWLVAKHEESKMTTIAHQQCEIAMIFIRSRKFDLAIANLRLALRGTTHPRAKSKLMLAIRELKRAASRP